MKYIVSICLAFIVSCQATVYLVLPQEVDSLKPPLEDWLQSSPWKERFHVSQTIPPDAQAVLIVSTNPGLESTSLEAQPFPKSWVDENSYSIPASIAVYSRMDSGDWASIPLYYTLWGATVFSQQATKIEAQWSKLAATKPPVTILTGGGTPAFRQAAFFLQSFNTPPTNEFDWIHWFTQTSNDWKLALNEFPTLVRQSNWVPNFWRMTRADLHSLYKPIAKNAVFLESYRDFETSNPGGNRSFAPLWEQDRSGLKAIAGQIVFLTLRGTKSAINELAPFVQGLLAQELQTKIGTASKWLAVNTRVPELNNDGANARKMASSAKAFFAVTDWLPDPLPEKSLLTEIQLKVEQVPRK